MSRSWLNPGATSSSSSAVSGGGRPVHVRGWLAASHETQAYGSPVSSGAGSETSTRGWLTGLSHTSGSSSAEANAAGRGTSIRSWLQPGASAQPKPNSPPTPKCGCGRAWMEPSAMAQPGETCGSHRSRAWLEPGATGEPQVKRRRVEGPGPPPPVNSERNLHLDLLPLMLASDEADHLTKYALNGMDTARVRRVLQNPCDCTTGSRCRARQLPVTGVTEYCERFHHLSEECQTHLISTSYETCGSPVSSVQRTSTQWHLLGVPVCVSALAAILGVTPRTLYKRVHKSVDLRKGTWSVQPLSLIHI